MLLPGLMPGKLSFLTVWEQDTTSGGDRKLRGQLPAAAALAAAAPPEVQIQSLVQDGDETSSSPTRPLMCRREHSTLWPRLKRREEKRKSRSGERRRPLFLDGHV